MNELVKQVVWSSRQWIYYLKLMKSQKILETVYSEKF